MQHAPSTSSGVSCQVFPATADQVPAARRLLATILDGCAFTGDAVLCLSEIVTNALQHSNSARPGGTFSIRAGFQHGRLRVEVEDEGGRWEPRPASDGQRGRGLLIVAALAATWGTSCDGAGARVTWFEI